VDELLDMGLRGSIMAVQRPVNVPAGTRFACRYIDD
jgi:hypothetical protein